MADYYIRKGAVGGNGSALLPWGTGAEFVAGTPNGSLGGSHVYVAGDGTANRLDGQWALGDRINFEMDQWGGEAPALLDFSAAGASQGTIHKTSGWGGELHIHDIDIINSATGVGGTAAIYFQGINSASADIEINCDLHDSRVGAYILQTSNGILRLSGGRDANTVSGGYILQTSGGTIYCECDITNSGSNGLYVATTSGGLIRVNGETSLNGLSGILVDGTTAGSVQILRLKSFSNTQHGIWIKTAANGTVLLGSNLVYKNSVGTTTYQGIRLSDTAVGVKVYRQTVVYNEGEGIHIDAAVDTGADLRGNISAFNGVVDLSVHSSLINHVTLTLRANNIYRTAGNMITYRGVTYTSAQWYAFIHAADGAAYAGVTGAAGPDPGTFPNGRASMNFDAGVNQALALRNLTYPGNRPGTGAFRIFVAFTNTLTNDSTLFTNMTDDPTGGGLIVQLNRTIANELRNVMWDSGVLSGVLGPVGTGFNDGSPHVFMIGRMIGTGALGVDQMVVKLDNVHVAGSPFDLPAGFASVNNPGTTNPVTGWLLLGCGASAPTSGQRYLGPAEMGEFVMYKTELTPIQETAVFNYLHSRWRI